MENLTPHAAHSRAGASKEVLTTAELLHHILIHANPETKASSSRVCRHWFDPAIKVLWDRAHLIDVAKLLAPVSWNGNQQSYIFTRVLRPEDWKRFLVYAAHVRWIESGIFAEHTSPLLEVMATTRPVYHMFPALTGVIWNALEAVTLAQSVVFMSPTVTSLDFSVDDIGSNIENFHAFCAEIQSRLPHLTEINIATCFPDSTITGAVAGLIKNLPHLEICRLPKHAFTTELTLNLSRLPKLQEISWFTWMIRPPTAPPPLDTEPIDFRDLTEGAFASLTWLRLTANFRDARKLVEHVHGPRFLTRFLCDALRSEVPHEMGDLVTTIAALCPRLEAFTVISNVFTEVDPQAHPAWSWDLLRPILQCRSLVKIIVRHERPLSITEKELEELACDRTTWKCIMLTPFPSFSLSPQPNLSPSALLPFSGRCPQLEKIGLFIDGDLRLPDTREEPQFPLLEELCFGFSPISEESIGAIGWFLAGMCARPVNVQTFPPASLVPPPPNLELESRASRWKRVEVLQNGICSSQWFTSLREENVVLRRQVEDLGGRRRALVGTD